jgi:homoserine O-acetyltransferase
VTATYYYHKPFTLESGVVLPTLQITYTTYGRLNAEASNVIWVCHALTANSDVAEWWPHSVEPGRFLDPDRYFIVCANILGSHYGTTGPLDAPTEGAQPWYSDFPRITVRDMVACHRLLADYLHIGKIHCIIGGSIGGFQALEWAATEPNRFRNAVFIATAPRTGGWVAAFNESQRMAIECDSTFGQPSPEAGATGLATARSIALLSYRNAYTYDHAQFDVDDPASNCFDHRAHSYQRYQGEKLRRRFNAYSYYRLTQAIDSHDIGRGRGGVQAALGTLRCRALVIAVSSDQLFSLEEHQLLAQAIPQAQYAQIESFYGHDGFLIEYEQLNRMIQEFIR